ncbi:unnamed protein product, partial [Ectocarpus sp. 13 AM-2016]
CFLWALNCKHPGLETLLRVVASANSAISILHALLQNTASHAEDGEIHAAELRRGRAF